MMDPRIFALGLVVLSSACLEAGSPVGQPAPSPGDESAPIFEAFTVPKPSFDFGTVVNPDHGAHSAPALHAIGHGLKLLGHTGVQAVLPPGMKGSITQIDVWKGYAVVAGFDGGPAFVIVDIKDPKSPKPLSYVPTISYGWSARFSDDGAYVFFGCQVISGGNYAPQGVVRGDCEDATKVHGRIASPSMGVSVYNVEDKARPKFVHWIPTNGTHNLQVVQIDGVDIIVTNFSDIIQFDRATQKLSVIAKVPGRHDATIVRHPVTKDWLMYTGTGELGIYNVNDPANPYTVLEAGGFKGGTGWHEQVAFPTVVDGRVLLALAGETYQSTTGTVPDKVTIVDITDPENPVKLAQWSPPFANAKVPWVSYTYSIHEMAATPQGQLAVSWYHGGVWVLDLSTKERQGNPVIVAAYQPHENINVLPSTFQQTPVPQVPFVWGAGWDERGYLVVPDMHTGVYVLEPDWGLRRMLDSGT